MQAWLKDLNPEQLEVVAHQDGPCVVLAQAGSGKTTALTRRIVRLVNEDVAPESILAVTFSKKAADEMNERIARLGITSARVGTWHSFCLQILKQDQTEYGTWDIDEKDRAKGILKNVIGYKGMKWTNVDFGALRSFIGLCKANVFDPGSAEAAALAKKMFYFAGSRACEAYQHLQEQLSERGLLTFDDFLVFAVKHLENEDNRQSWASKFNFVLQDEAQDANRAQCRLATLLAKDHRNYMVVGDVAQSIYGFRGSSPEFLAGFSDEWEGSKVIQMHRNYRSGRAIVKFANEVIRPASVRCPGDMTGERDLDGEVKCVRSVNLDDESNLFASWVQDNVSNGIGYGEHVALFRTNAQSRALEESLLSRKIPYVVVGGVSFYERKEVKDLLAYLHVAADWDQTGDVMKRCINAPFRFLGSAFLERVLEGTRIGETWPDTVKRVATEQGIQSRQKASAADWADIIKTLSREIVGGGESAKPAAMLAYVVNRTKYIDWLEKEEGAESIESSPAANVRELIRVAERFASVKELFDFIHSTIEASRKQRTDGQAGGDRVLLMNIHRSKGLEWPRVWVVGCNDQILPHARGDIEEERRLLYVATTRARDEAVVSFVTELATRTGVREAKPSPFLIGLASTHPQVALVLDSHRFN